MTLQGSLQAIIAFGPEEAFPFVNELLIVHSLEYKQFNQDCIQRIYPLLKDWNTILGMEIKKHLEQYL